MKIKNITFLFLLFFFSINQANSLEKIVFFDIDYIVSKSNAGIKISEKLKKQNKKNIEFLKKEQKKLQKEIEEIKKVQNIITKDELEKKVATQPLSTLVDCRVQVKNDKGMHGLCECFI